MKALKPRAAFQVPNTLTGEGNLNVELTFESMDDFSPAAVARRVDALNKLLEARQQLANLITYMDGKTGAEELVARLLQDPALLQTLATTKKLVATGTMLAMPLAGPAFAQHSSPNVRSTQQALDESASEATQQQTQMLLEAQQRQQLAGELLVAVGAKLLFDLFE